MNKNMSAGGGSAFGGRIKIVDGFKIRNTYDIDFGMLADYFNTPYLKPGEIWLDKIYLPEKKRILSEYQESRRLMKKYGYEKAKKMLRFKKVKGFKIETAKLKLLKKQNKFKIYLVNGRKIRDNFDPNFFNGGHYLVYKYIPKNEIWVDSVALTKERKYIIIHELSELKLMQRGKDYNDAHDYANAAEKEARRRDGAVYVTD